MIISWIENPPRSRNYSMHECLLTSIYIVNIYEKVVRIPGPSNLDNLLLALIFLTIGVNTYLLLLDIALLWNLCDENKWDEGGIKLFRYENDSFTKGAKQLKSMFQQKLSNYIFFIDGEKSRIIEFMNNRPFHFHAEVTSISKKTMSLCILSRPASWFSRGYFPMYSSWSWASGMNYVHAVACLPNLTWP